MHKIGDIFLAKGMMIEYKIFSAYHLDGSFNWKARVLQKLNMGFKVNSTPH